MDHGGHVLGHRAPRAPQRQHLGDLGRRVAADAARHRAPGADDLDHRPGLEVAVDPRDPGQQEGLLAHCQGPGRPGVDQQAPLGHGGVGHPQASAGAVRAGRGQPGPQVVREGRAAQEGHGVVGPGDEGGGSAGAGDGGRLDLGTHAPCAQGRPPVGDVHARQVSAAGHVAQGAGPGGPGPGRPHPVHVGQQDQDVGGDQVGDEGRQAVVVPEAELGGGHRVVLVDYGHGPHGQQGVEGGPHGAVVAAHGHVLGGEQHLGGHGPVGAHGRLPAGDQASLPHRGGRLEQTQLRGTVLHAQGGQARGHGPGGDQDHVVPAVPQAGNETGQDVNAVEVQPAVVTGQGGGADLEDHPGP